MVVMAMWEFNLIHSGIFLLKKKTFNISQKDIYTTNRIISIWNGNNQVRVESNFCSRFLLFKKRTSEYFTKAHQLCTQHNLLSVSEMFKEPLHSLLFRYSQKPTIQISWTGIHNKLTLIEPKSIYLTELDRIRLDESNLISKFKQIDTPVCASIRT